MKKNMMVIFGLAILGFNVFANNDFECIGERLVSITDGSLIERFSEQEDLYAHDGRLIQPYMSANERCAEALGKARSGMVCINGQLKTSDNSLMYWTTRLDGRVYGFKMNYLCQERLDNAKSGMICLDGTLYYNKKREQVQTELEFALEAAKEEQVQGGLIHDVLSEAEDTFIKFGPSFIVDRIYGPESVHIEEDLTKYGQSYLAFIHDYQARSTCERALKKSKNGFICSTLDTTTGLYYILNRSGKITSKEGWHTLEACNGYLSSLD